MKFIERLGFFYNFCMCSSSAFNQEMLLASMSWVGMIICGVLIMLRYQREVREYAND